MYQGKYQYIINKREIIGLKLFNDPNVFIEYSNDMQDVYKIINEINSGKNRKILTIFDDMIADMINSKKLNLIVIELFTRSRKLSISLVFSTQSHFRVPKDVRLNSIQFFIMKIPDKRELQRITLNSSSDIAIKILLRFIKNVLQNHIRF